MFNFENKSYKAKQFILNSDLLGSFTKDFYGVFKLNFLSHAF
ncbi:hypothetical protein PAGA_a1778 [Pseudoalteromonas agarivorans DSM 14585]|uniref:Uncharacterized protein n=1 Tax=Pseudoalteromonas agarivorans DSM 14585 TaxID=1312369 RepID=A0ACA8DVF6_9GAMM|nr:hypothetical protein PAGA_a1778 [Pseudoalteromonas agarivorans DSM 14585]